MAGFAGQIAGLQRRFGSIGWITRNLQRDDSSSRRCGHAAQRSIAAERKTGRQGARLFGKRPGIRCAPSGDLRCAGIWLTGGGRRQRASCRDVERRRPHSQATALGSGLLAFFGDAGEPHGEVVVPGPVGVPLKFPVSVRVKPGGSGAPGSATIAHRYCVPPTALKRNA